MAGALDVLLADWADRCRAAGGLVVAAHFPLPYAEIAADIVAGKIDALETQALAPGLDDPAVLEWYRYLNLGYRLPIVAGTDKMSSEVPIGAVPGVRPPPDRRAAHVRRLGRRRPGRPDLRDVRPGAGAGGRRPRAGRRHPPPLGRPGRDRRSVPGPPSRSSPSSSSSWMDASWAGRRWNRAPLNSSCKDTREVAAGAWIAARSRSRNEIASAFTTSMAAHTSPVYVEVEGRPFVPSAEDAGVVEQVIAGARTWVAELAAVAEPAERARMVAFLDASLARFQRRMRGEAE